MANKKFVAWSSYRPSEKISAGELQSALLEKSFSLAFSEGTEITLPSNVDDFDKSFVKRYYTLSDGTESWSPALSIKVNGHEEELSLSSFKSRLSSLDGRVLIEGVSSASSQPTEIYSALKALLGRKLIYHVKEDGFMRKACWCVK